MQRFCVVATGIVCFGTQLTRAGLATSSVFSVGICCIVHTMDFFTRTGQAATQQQVQSMRMPVTEDQKCRALVILMVLIVVIFMIF